MMKVFKDILFILTLLSISLLIMWAVEGEKIKRVFEVSDIKSTDSVDQKADSALYIVDQKIYEVNQLKDQTQYQIDSLKERINQKTYSSKSELQAMKSKIDNLTSENNKKMELETITRSRIVNLKVIKFDTVRVLVMISDTVHSLVLKTDTVYEKQTFTKSAFGKIKKQALDPSLIDNISRK